MRTSNCFVIVLSCHAIASTGLGELPLGLTMIDTESAMRAALSIYDDVGFVASDNTVWSVASERVVMPVSVVHPETGVVPARLTPVVQSDDGQFYVGAVFENESTLYYDPQSAWLFRLGQEPQSIANWGVDGQTGLGPDIVGFDRNLRGVGQQARFSPEGEWSTSEFFLDGSIRNFDVPDDPILNQSLGALITNVAESGFAVGYAGVPGTAGVAATIWSPGSEFSFILTDEGRMVIPLAGSVRDRSDGSGINIGFGLGEGSTGVKLGERDFLRFEESGALRGRAIVSQTEFVAINVNEPLTLHSGYYPGIVPHDVNAVLPLTEIFPELLNVNFDTVHDVFAVKGNIFMTLSGPDGLYLFGARDPSVIPEPATWVLLLVMAPVAGFHVR